MMWPTLASLLEERLWDDPHATHVVVHAFNEWMHEHWTYSFDDRIYATPVITLPIIDEALRELDYVVEHGAQAILIRPAPVPDFNGRRRSFALPEYDRFWERVQEADVMVGMHSSDSGFQRYLNEWEGYDSEFLPFAQKPSAFSAIVGADYRTISDVVASIIGHGLATRFPKLRFVPVENGSAWVRPLVTKFKKIYERSPELFDEDPMVAFNRCVYVHPFHEEDTLGLVELLGADNVALRVRLSAPRGDVRPDHLRRRDRRTARVGPGQDHGREPGQAHEGGLAPSQPGGGPGPPPSTQRAAISSWSAPSPRSASSSATSFANRSRATTRRSAPPAAATVSRAKERPEPPPRASPSAARSRPRRSPAARALWARATPAAKSPLLSSLAHLGAPHVAHEDDPVAVGGQHRSATLEDERIPAHHRQQAPRLCRRPTPRHRRVEEVRPDRSRPLGQTLHRRRRDGAVDHERRAGSQSGQHAGRAAAHHLDVVVGANAQADDVHPGREGARIGRRLGAQLHKGVEAGRAPRPHRQLEAARQDPSGHRAPLVPEADEPDARRHRRKLAARGRRRDEARRHPAGTAKRSRTARLSGLPEPSQGMADSSSRISMRVGTL